MTVSPYSPDDKSMKRLPVFTLSYCLKQQLTLISATALKECHSQHWLVDADFVFQML